MQEVQRPRQWQGGGLHSATSVGSEGTGRHKSSRLHPQTVYLVRLSKFIASLGADHGCGEGLAYEIVVAVPNVVRPHIVDVPNHMIDILIFDVPASWEQSCSQGFISAMPKGSKLTLGGGPTGWIVLGRSSWIVLDETLIVPSCSLQAIGFTSGCGTGHCIAAVQASANYACSWQGVDLVVGEGDTQSAFYLIRHGRLEEA